MYLAWAGDQVHVVSSLRPMYNISFFSLVSHFASQDGNVDVRSLATSTELGLSPRNALCIIWTSENRTLTRDGPDLGASLKFLLSLHVHSTQIICNIVGE